MSAKQRISTARATLVMDHPFFGALALRLRVVEDTSKTDTAATDGRSLFYCAAFVDTLSDVELVGLLAHEVMHPAMQHHTRRGGRDPERWNIAADHAINPVLVQAGFTLPQGALLDSQYEGLSAEQIYDKLPLSPPSSGDGKGQADPDAVKRMPGAVLDAPEPSQDAAEWQVAVTQAAQAAKRMGALPGSMSEIIEEIKRPRTDWRALLRRFVQQRAAADYSWRMPNRRYLTRGLYLPELRSESMPPIVVVDDTSGSTSPFRALFKGELQSIVDECMPEATIVICADSKVQRVDRFERGEPISMYAAGGGGTNFCPAFEYVEAEQLQPACLIYLTDGEGNYPDTPPDYPVLWAMTTSVEAPWGEIVRIEETT